MRKIIIVDISSHKSVIESEKKKWKLENEGYNLKGIIPVGLEKITMVYEK